MLANSWRIIYEGFENYKEDSPLSIIEQIDDDTYVMTWDIHDTCNLNCEYCFNSDTDRNLLQEEAHIYRKNDIIDFFKRTKKKWIFNISGGEPFLYPDFINITESLSNENYIYINTNLTTLIFNETIIRNFTNINKSINASFHPSQMKQQHFSEIYCNNFTFLKNNNFDIYASIVAYPGFFNQLEEILSYLNSKNVYPINIQYFIGKVNNIKYPEAYSRKETDFISKQAFGMIKTINGQHIEDFSNKICLAGYKYFSMDYYGNIFRCHSINEDHGNMLERTIIFDKKEKQCGTSQCGCLMEGILCSKRK